MFENVPRNVCGFISESLYSFICFIASILQKGFGQTNGRKKYVLKVMNEVICHLCLIKSGKIKQKKLRYNVKD